MSRAPSSPEVSRLEKIATGIEGLDVILRGGFFQGGITIVQGSPGAGKTILGNQLCFNHVAAGGRALYVTLLAENHSRMLLHIGMLDFFRINVIADQLSYLSAFPALEADGIRGLLNLLRREVRAHKATLLVLDGLVAAETAAGSDMEFKKFIHELQTQATSTNCAMCLLSSGGVDDGLTTAEHTMVDCVIKLRSTLFGWRAVRDLEVQKRRGDGFLRGRHAFRITDAGIVIFPRLEAMLATPSRRERLEGPRVSTGVPQLDNMFGDGFPPASSTILLGPSGSGKTTLGLHFLSQCSQHVPGLFFGFHESAAAIRAKANAFGLPFVDRLDQGHVEIFWQPTTEALVDEACAHLLAAVRARGVRLLFVDGLGGFSRLADEPDRLGHILIALINELAALGVTSIFAKESDDFLGSLWTPPPEGLTSASLSEIVDNILLFQFVKLRSTFYRAVSAFKVRDSRIEDRQRLFQITGSGIVVDDDPERAESVLTEVTEQPGTLPPTKATRSSRRRGA